jgi:sulfatase maturation enzyme AslB (radical SAM superfamily)
MSNEYIKGDKVKNINGELVSGYILNAQTVFEELNQVSPSFCLAKWFNVSLHIPTGQTHSCYHPRSHKIPMEEVAIDVSALHNTKYKKEQRRAMLHGERPPECSFCWETEDNGDSLSDRAYRSKDIYEEGIIEEAKRVGFTGNARPRYVEVNFNQACNFRCTYCSPHLSTAWQQDIERNGAYILSDRWHNDLTWVKKLNIDNGPDNPYLKAFWQWLPDIYPTLHTFRMTGGEPLMDKNTFRMFDYVKENPKADLHLSITSNCCPPGDQWQKFMSGLKEITDRDAIDHFMLFCSLDSWGRQAEYIRDGLAFDTLYANVTEYLRDSRKHSLTFIITYNVLSYPGFFNYIENILKLRQTYNTDRQLIWFDVPQLSSPEWMDPRLAPEMVTELERALTFMRANKETWTTRFKGFKDFEIDKLQRLIDWIRGSGFDNEIALKNFYLYFAEHDRRRGTEFLSVFPELNRLWEKSKQLNGQ